MKKIILMRHGDYDFNHLSEEGKQEVDRAAEQMVADGLVPEVIVHSPVTRAVETAQRVQAVFNRVAGKNVSLVEIESLDVGSTDEEDLLSDINDNVSRVLVITHQPNVESLSQQFGKYVSPLTAETNVFESDAERWRNVHRAKFVSSFK